MENLTVKSELLEPMVLNLEAVLNRLMKETILNNKETEINLKITLDYMPKSKVTDDGEKLEWKEPTVDYQITEKIKEYKSTKKGVLGFDYAVRQSEDGKNIIVEKINKQLSVFDED